MALNQLYKIPSRSGLCHQKNKGIILPEGVPYIGWALRTLHSKLSGISESICFRKGLPIIFRRLRQL